MQPHSIASGTGGGPGGIAFSDSAPGGFRFLSPCRKEQRDSNELLGNVLISIMSGSIPRSSVPTGQLSSGGSLLYDKVAVLYRLRGTPSLANRFAAIQKKPLPNGRRS